MLGLDVTDGQGYRRTSIENQCGTLMQKLSLLWMRLDFNFSAQLMFHSFFLYLGFEEDFQGHNEMAFLEPSQVHIPKFSLAQRMPNFKVINCELPQPDRGRRKKLQFGSEVEGERDPERSPSFSTFLSLCPLSLLKGPARVSGQQLSVP